MEEAPEVTRFHWLAPGANAAVCTNRLPPWYEVDSGIVVDHENTPLALADPAKPRPWSTDT